MKRVTAMLTVLALMCVAATPGAMAAKKKGKAQLGVFGTVNGKSFKATSRDGAGDACVYGTFAPSLRNVSFVAFECKAKRRRQGAQKKNYKGMVISCQGFGEPGTVLTPPFTLACATSVYEESKTGKFGLPVSSSRWIANSDSSDPVNPTSNLNLRVDSFDGTNLHGALTGSFDLSGGGPGSEVPAPISGEVTIDFPIVLR